MREILFRGKRKDDGEWVYGYLVGLDLICPDYPSDVSDALGNYYDETPYVGFVEIDPETVGQFTGLTDRNGTKIFEGDIVAESYTVQPNKIYRHLPVEFVLDRGGWFPFANGDGCGCCEDKTLTPADDGLVCQCVIAGNIHDNPKLLEEKNGALDN